MPDKFKNRFKTKGGGTKTFDQMTEGDKVIFKYSIYNDGRRDECISKNFNTRGRQAERLFLRGSVYTKIPYNLCPREFCWQWWYFWNSWKSYF